MKTLMTALIVAVLILRLESAAADPAFQVRYLDGVPRIEIAGSYPQSRYTISRGSSVNGEYQAISDFNTLCMGACFTDDYTAQPGQTYWYRFDLVLSDGTLARFGPYAATISADQVRLLGARVSPNPGRGPTGVVLFRAGAPGELPAPAEAVLFDLQGRRVSTVFQGPLPTGRTSLSWSGRGDDGREVRAGTYFLRVTTGARQSTTRVFRVR